MKVNKNKKVNKTRTFVFNEGYQTSPTTKAKDSTKKVIVEKVVVKQQPLKKCFVEGVAQDLQYVYIPLNEKFEVLETYAHSDDVVKTAETEQEIVENIATKQPTAKYVLRQVYAVNESNVAEIEGEDSLFTINEGWFHFEYESGANPYIAKTEKERDRILKKYNGKVDDLGDGSFLIHDSAEKDNFAIEEAMWGWSKNYIDYDPKEGWTDEDIELHKSIDWKGRNFKEYEVADDAFTGKVHVYGRDKEDDNDYIFHKFLRPNPIYPPYYKAVNFDKSGLLGPMYDGNHHGTYKVHDRYETQAVYDMLSESKKSRKALRDGKRHVRESVETPDEVFTIVSKTSFYLGDLCYALKDEIYDDVWGKQYKYADGSFEVPGTGLKFAVVGTAYGDGEYDIAGFTVGCVEKANLIDGSKVAEGDVLVGIASTGVHSNGFSLVRKIISDNNIDLHSYSDELGGVVGEVLLTPTRIYCKQVLDVMKDVDVHGVAHITGGGFDENIPRILKDNMGLDIVEGSWPILPVFKFLEKYGKVDHREMFNIYNMGIGMVIAVKDEKDAKKAIDILAKHGDKAYIIGSITNNAGKVEIHK